jgi:hypothetical protein
MAVDLEARVIVVLTRVSDGELHVTYCNDLGEPRPYIVTVVLHGPPFVALGASVDDVPGVGVTISRVVDAA